MTVIDPEVGSEPDHVPLALQPVAFEVLQVRVALWPGSTATGLSEILSDVGAAGVDVVRIEFGPLLHPERTSNEMDRNAKAKERRFLVRAGKCIGPPAFHELETEFRLGFKETHTE